MRERNTAFWAIDQKDVIKQLNSSEEGLSAKEAKNRIEKFGYNEVSKKKRRLGLEIFLSQFKNALVLVLIIAALISYFLGETTESVVILAIVFFNAVLGFVQEYKAEKALKALEKYVSVKAKVIRNGEKAEIDAKELVPGDVVSIAIGDIIPADIRLITAEGLSLDESVLTGESMPVTKETDVISSRYSLPSQLKNMVFMGTSVSTGLGKGIVVATGENTQFGKTTTHLKERTESDFEKNIKAFSNFLLKIILIMTIFIFAVNAMLGKGTFDSFLFAIALAVGITPEVLPIIITITMSNSALRMAKEKVIIKKLDSVEDIGNMDTLCCDKTGTLTEGEIFLIKSIDVDKKNDERVLLYGLLCNDAVKAKGKKYFGSPIDRAIIESKEAKRVEKKFKNYKIIAENEFDFERRRMSVIAKGEKEQVLIVKGAYESVLSVSRFAMIKGARKEITKNLLNEIKKRIESFEEDGYRVIAVAAKQTKKNHADKFDERDLALLGFLLLLDPPKKTAKEALDSFKNLGVDLKILSGDSPIITKKICREVGLNLAEGKIVTGEELEELNSREFEEFIRKYNVFARVTPTQKYEIVAGLNKAGHIVGFLGDGINDVPALKAADIGISVNSAVEIAKEAADIILLKKSLRALAKGIHEGRKTFGNITKYILNTISANFGNMFTVAASSLFLRFIPLLPSQILLNNFLSDIPLLTVAADNVDKDFLKKPKRWNINFISEFMLYFGLLSVVFDLMLIFVLMFFMNASEAVFRTAWFVESVLSEIIVTFSVRTKLPFFKSRPSSLLLISSVAVCIISVLVTFTLFGNTFFAFEQLNGNVLMLIAGILVMYFISAEIVKHFFFKRFEI